MRQRIRGRLALGTLAVMGVTVIVLSVSSTGSAAQGRGAGSGAQKPRPSQRIYGVVPASRAGHKPRRGDFANTAFATVDNLAYHGGPVMHTNTVYAIYWVPPGYSVSANYQTLINR